MRERALVLGGGGASGNAWVIGVIAGLFDAGMNVTESDLIVGTSAGATAAAQLTSAIEPPALLADILAPAPTATDSSSSDRERVPNRPAGNHMEMTGGIIAAASTAADMRRRMGAALLERSEALGIAAQARWRATVAARLRGHQWPQRPLLITAVDADTGEPVVFDRHGAVDLVDAVAASTSGGFAYTVGNHRYFDGGYRANENADLAAGYARVLVLSPLGGRTRHPLAWRTSLAAHVDELRARGSMVETIFPDAESQRALGAGMSLMDLSARAPSARAGYEQGRARAEQLEELWR